MRRFSTLIAAAVCCMFLFSNCSKDDKKGEFDDLTPDGHKEQLEKIGLKLIGKINPDEHKELVQTVNTFIELADEGGLDIEQANFAGDFVRTVGAVASKNDLGALVAYNSVKAEIYQVKNYYGIYTYNQEDEVWDYKESDSKLEFIFPADGKQAVITMAASGQEAKLEIDGDTWMVPPTAEGVVKRDNKDLCLVKMKNTTNPSANTVNLEEAKLEIPGGDYVFFAKGNFTEKEATAEFSLKKSNETLISGDCKVNGQSMTNIDEIEKTDNWEDLFNSAETYVKIMDDMYVRANCSAIKTMVKELDEVDYDKYDEEEKYEQERANIINKYTKAEMFYTDSDKVIANFEFQPYVNYEWTSSNGEKYQEWELEPIIIFTYDDSRYSFEEYFGKNNFTELINAAEKLAKEYEKFLN